MSRLIISSSDLVKKSAMAICHARINKIKPVVSDRMIAGDKSAKEKSVSHLIEMVGTYRACERFDMKYTFDEIIQNESSYILIEHKHFETEVEEWFLNSSLIQTALYNSLVTVNPNKTYVTAEYEIEKGFPEYTIDLDRNYMSVLDIKDKKYEVIVTHPEELVKFYVTKGLSTFDYTHARMWDAVYSKKEYEKLNNFFISKLLE